MGEDSVQAFGAWAGSFPWHTWATLTYAPVSPYSGREQVPTIRSARRAMEWIVESGRVRAAVWATERGKRFGRVHNHALLSFFPDDPWSVQVDQDETERLWERVYGFAQMEPFDPERGAAGYVGKYLRKQECDWDLWQASKHSPTRRSASRNDWNTTNDFTLTSRKGMLPQVWQSGKSWAARRRESQAGIVIPPTSEVCYDGTKRVTPESSTNPRGNPGTCRILIRDSRGQ